MTLEGPGAHRSRAAPRSRTASGAAPTATGIVLAGGRSTRFGRDKLAEPIEGRTLLDLATEAVAAVVADVVVVVAPGSDPFGRDQPPSNQPPSNQPPSNPPPSNPPPSNPPPSNPPPARPGTSIRIAHDPEPFGGPLIGLLAGLEAASEPLALVVGGDMPGLRAEVLVLMLERLATSPDADAVALDDGGRVRPLPLAVRVGAGTSAAGSAVERGARSLHALLDGLRVAALPEPMWRAFDPAGETLRDIDHPGDLEVPLE